MATTRPLYLGVLTTACLTLAALVGCQSQPQTSMVGELPSPNFSGPMAVARPMPQPIAPVAPRATPAPAPRHLAPHTPLAGIPRDWIPHVPPRSWQAIVIHHSDTPAGGA